VNVLKLKIGDRVQVRDEDDEEFYMFKEQKVTDIRPFQYEVQVFLDGHPEPWYFRPNEDAVWPRRRDAQIELHLIHDPFAFELCVGDHFPPNDGGVTAGFENYWEVVSVKWFDHIEQWRIIVKSSQGALRLLVNGISGKVNTQDCYILPYHAVIDPEKKPSEPKPIHSGIYKNVRTGEEVVFRFEGVRGRPAKNAKPLPETAKNPSSWEDWELYLGAPHPSDPRYS
jgi:hypothetical protein